MRLCLPSVAALTLLLAAGCGARTQLGGRDDGAASRRDSTPARRDGAAVRDSTTRPDARSTEFCAGSRARAELNGNARVLQLVQGDLLAMGCCDGVSVLFQIEVEGQTHTLAARLLQYGGSAPNRPETFDLSRLPDGWELRVDYLRCVGPSCPTAGSLSTGPDIFEGTARIEGPSFPQALVSLCLSARTGLSDAPQVLRSVRLYADRVPVLPIP